MDGPSAVRAEDALRLIYAEVFAEPPYGETAADLAASFRRFRHRTEGPGFRGALARTARGEPVGMAYGWPLPPETDWWDRLVEPAEPTELVAGETRREDGRRTFGLMELAVRSRWRGQGIARRLHESLLDGVGAERVLLNVRPDAGAAGAAYRAWGYRRVGEFRPADGTDSYDLMLLRLR
ncbi:GNAT family N-acetyltransferase [Streptomyces qinzhouensis]|uniref:GNAT family N-acetyltransferase n=1 Tax=Streptomyces qinzhouensis TaxID=2599401 RepID=A0A5B8IQH9_9ACTN|nr:GNAT family N-acetyltransferase [Streptomyces qinzhouensis]QDY80938.1 GNAT family N-acetyltransferase [Streptomyces qinzhouensis]